MKGDIPDNGMLPFICKLDDKKEILDKTKWPKANPTLNYIGSMEYADTLMHELEIEFGDYLLDPTGNASFATKRMNIPQGDKENEVTFGKIEPKSRKTDGFMALTAARTVSDKLDATAKMNSVELGVWRY